MPAIRFHTEDLGSPSTFPQWFIDEDGQVKALVRLRLFCDVLIGKDPASAATNYDPALDLRLSYPSLLDTGAWLTIFPRKIWSEFDQQITWLRLRPEELAGRAADRQTPRSVVMGHSFSYRLGRVWVGAYDREGRLMPAVRVLAMFQEVDLPGAEPRPLLGLWGGILEGRYLERQPALERNDPDPPHAPLHGQRWWLCDY